ncbi:PREDICTED: uncharacterized protein LOC108565648 [Nicrophorus vespilloides]|uniref:acid phosphatase n=1 Tax=Nicrophorus vespilloides TaxID=110193 RepID=A0ABM1N1K0_NICVS|nr:PREDICTED: uncharacterized protein LOC108565648 [Nicrophorus vespilloides]
MRNLSLLLLFFLSTGLSYVLSEKTLILTHVIFRHGDRTPDYSFQIPNNPYSNETFFPYGPGQLTLKGKTRAYNLGVSLRKRYSRFLGPVYYNGLIDATSSFLPRAVMSLQSVLAALFKPTKRWQLKRTIKWQPVYFKAPSLKEDKIVIPSCPKIFDVHTDFDEESKAFYKYVSDFVGFNVTKSIEMMAIHNTYHVLDEQGFSLPKWVLAVWPEPLLRYSLQFWKDMSDQTVQYAVGPLLKKINDDTMAKMKGTSIDQLECKMYLYSGHDMNVVGYLGAIGVYKEALYINYSASIMIEIHKYTDTYGVKVFFDNSDGIGPILLRIPACGGIDICPLEKYIAITKNKYGPKEWCAAWFKNVKGGMQQLTRVKHHDCTRRHLLSIQESKIKIMWRLLFLLSAYLATVFSAPGIERETLLLTHIIFRHGDRTPDFHFFKTPNDPLAHETFFPYGSGQLTLKGKIRAYELGAKLRKRYSNFLGALYYADLIEGISSSAPRCVMSMQSVFAALFPPTEEWQLKFGYDWQPVYFLSPSVNEDKLIYPSCPKIFDVQSYMDGEKADFYKYVSENFGVNITTSFDMLGAQNTYQVLGELGYNLPEWVSKVWPQPFYKYGMEFWNEMASQKVPYAIGNLLKKINEDTMKKVTGDLVPTDRKMFLYSGHDLNLVAFFGAIGVYKQNMYIDYSASIMIEVHKVRGRYGVKIFFDNVDGKGPQLIKIPACAYLEICPLEIYIAITKAQYGPEDWCT